MAGTLGHDAWIPVNSVDLSEHGAVNSAHSTTPAAGGITSAPGRSSGGDGHNPIHGGHQPSPVSISLYCCNEKSKKHRFIYFVDVVLVSFSSLALEEN